MKHTRYWEMKKNAKNTILLAIITISKTVPALIHPSLDGKEGHMPAEAVDSAISLKCFLEKTDWI